MQLKSSAYMHSFWRRLKSRLGGREMNFAENIQHRKIYFTHELSKRAEHVRQSIDILCQRVGMFSQIGQSSDHWIKSSRSWLLLTFCVQF